MNAADFDDDVLALIRAWRTVVGLRGAQRALDELSADYDRLIRRARENGLEIEGLKRARNVLRYAVEAMEGL